MHCCWWQVVRVTRAGKVVADSRALAVAQGTRATADDRDHPADRVPRDSSGRRDETACPVYLEPRDSEVCWIFDARRDTSAAYAMTLCPFVCYKPVFYRKSLMDAEAYLYLYITAYCREIRVQLYLQKLEYFPQKISSQTLDFAKFRQGTSTVACVVNLVRPTIVVSLAHWSSASVYSWMGLRRRMALACLLQLTRACHDTIRYMIF